MTDVAVDVITGVRPISDFDEMVDEWYAYGGADISDGWSDKTRFLTGTCLEFTKGMDVKEMAGQLADIMLADG